MTQYFTGNQTMKESDFSAMGTNTTNFETAQACHIEKTSRLQFREGGSQAESGHLPKLRRHRAESLGRPNWAGVCKKAYQTAKSY